MPSSISPRLLAASLAGVIGCCVLGFYGTSGAQQTPPPFANAVELQAEVVAQLKELNAQIKEQNALLRSGRLQVIVVDKNAAEKNPAERKRH
jgi:hypothetical protein